MVFQCCRTRMNRMAAASSVLLVVLLLASLCASEEFTLPLAAVLRQGGGASASSSSSTTGDSSSSSSSSSSGAFILHQDDTVTFGDAQAYVTFSDAYVQFGSLDPALVQQGTAAFTLNPGVEVTIIDNGTEHNAIVLAVIDAQTGQHGMIQFYDNQVLLMPTMTTTPTPEDITLLIPTYNYTTDPNYGYYTNTDASTSTGNFIIMGSLPECPDFMIAFNADAIITASHDCGLFVGANAADSVTAVTTTIEDEKEKEKNEDATKDNTSVSTDTSSMLPVVDAPKHPVVTEEDDTENNDKELVLGTVGDDNAYMQFQEHAVVVGSSVTGANFTVRNVTIIPSKNGLVLTTPDGTTTLAFGKEDGTVVFTSSKSNALITVFEVTYDYREEEENATFVIYGSARACDDFEVSFTTNGVFNGPEHCGFAVADSSSSHNTTLAVEEEDTGKDGGAVTSSSDTTNTKMVLPTVSEDDNAFILFRDDSVTFGSYEERSYFGSSIIPGFNFTMQATTEVVTANGDIKMTTPEGSFLFTEDMETVTFTSSNPNADAVIITIFDPAYTYDINDNFNADAFIISGTTEECSDFFVSFSPDGVLSGSEDCGLVVGETTTTETKNSNDAGEGFVITEDMVMVGDEDAYIVFMEQYVTFGSSSAETSLDPNFTINATTAVTSKGIVLTMADGSILTFTDDDTVEFTGGANSVLLRLSILQPVYIYEGDSFIIAGSTKECTEFYLGVDWNGSLFGSEDCGFIIVDDNEKGKDDAGLIVKDELVDVIVATNPDADKSDEEDSSSDDSDDEECQSIVDITCGDEDFSDLCSLIGEFPELKESLESGKFTVFAPNNKAFDVNDRDWFGDQSKAATKNMLMLHIVAGEKIEYDDLFCDDDEASDSNLIEMLNGKHTRTICDDTIPYGQKGPGNKGMVLFVEGRFVDGRTNIQACNGVIHGIDGMLLD